jgi:hypothetical protein
VKPDGTGRVVIGWVEFVDLPDWKIRRLRAKVDTGARSSALHVENIRELKNGRVHFEVRLHRRKTERRVTVEAPITRRSPVRSSMGHSTTRIFVQARVRIGQACVQHAASEGGVRGARPQGQSLEHPALQHAHRGEPAAAVLS